MKWMRFVLATMVVSLVFTGCNDDEDGMNENNVPQQVLTTFQSMYPNTSAKWERESGKIKAEFWNKGSEAEAWFMTSGSWIRTETDYNKPLPEVVQAVINVDYSEYTVDDVDFVETAQDDYFEIELEQLAHPDVKLLIRPDGTVKSVLDNF